MSMIRFSCAILIALSLGIFTAQAQERPVVIGQDGADLDACGASGVVHNLNKDGDNYLTVRAAPTSKSAELDRLGAGARINFCEQRGRWIGIVYPPANQPDFDCGTGSAIASPQVYQGPCGSGWVFEKYVLLLAG